MNSNGTVASTAAGCVTALPQSARVESAISASAKFRLITRLRFVKCLDYD
jgi:hypothetical protein